MSEMTTSSGNKITRETRNIYCADCTWQELVAVMMELTECKPTVDKEGRALIPFSQLEHEYEVHGMIEINYEGRIMDPAHSWDLVGEEDIDYIRVESRVTDSSICAQRYSDSTLWRIRLWEPVRYLEPSGTLFYRAFFLGVQRLSALDHILNNQKSLEGFLDKAIEGMTKEQYENFGKKLTVLDFPYETSDGVVMIDTHGIRWQYSFSQEDIEKAVMQGANKDLIYMMKHMIQPIAK